jgi:adenine-specific DNA-methyltransferase
MPAMRTARTETRREVLDASELLDEVFARSEDLRLGTPALRRKEWGQYFTAPAVANFMASLLLRSDTEHARILDPGAGTGILGLAAAASLMSQGARSVELVAVEPEPRAREQLQACCARAAVAFGPALRISVIDTDVLALAEPELGTPMLEPFDVVISNPPYFKMSPGDQRAGGSPNIYTRFMEVSSRLLRPGGEICFIIPRSFASGLYFRRFRRDFHRRMSLMRVHVFESRRDAFRDDGVLQENIIVHYRRLPQPLRMDDVVEVSSSAGMWDIERCSLVRIPRRSILDTSDPNAILGLPASADDLRVLDHVRSWSHTLAHNGLEISTGPVVPFRARELLCQTSDGKSVVPLLWMQHVRAGGVTWPLPARFRKPEHILASAGEKLLVPNENYVLLRRFSAKEEARRLTAAPLLKGQLGGEWIGLENHLNFVHRPGGSLSEDEALGLAALFNSKILDSYFRVMNGNTQVNATDIRAMPLPPLARIKAIGDAVRRGATSDAVEEILSGEA